MKRLILLLAIVFGVTPVTMGEVSTKVYLADGITPLPPVDPPFPHIYTDIMVGTKLVILIGSDANDYWVGDLFITGKNRDYGVLTAASALPPVGPGAFVYFWEDDLYRGFCFQTDDPPEAGDWFVVDYLATNIGECKVGLYEWFSPTPSYELSFSHVRTRDFNQDMKVDFADFASLSAHWLETGCSDPNWCEGTDLDTDGNVDPNDLALFADYWLERTE